ncbi:MAG: Tim44 domain-containing protein [Pseudomonadota bacterium]|nr:Tim44 domain-containing protein [Pseudomonadota bacterium]
MARSLLCVLLLAALAGNAAADGHIGAAPQPALAAVPARHASNELMAPVTTAAGAAVAAEGEAAALAAAGVGADAAARPHISRFAAAFGLVGGALLDGLLLGRNGGLGGPVFVLLAMLTGAWLLRRFLISSPVPVTRGRTEPEGWGLAPPPQADPVPPLAAVAPDGSALRLPPGFDLSAFLREARLSFVRLQSANDRADIADLREFTTPHMFAALALEIQQQQQGEPAHEVMALDAQLLDLSVEHDQALASVRFHGSTREGQGPATPFTEVWHVRKHLSDPRSTWLLDGIQPPT